MPSLDITYLQYLDCCTKHSGKCVTPVPGSPSANRAACVQSWAGGSHCFETVTITINGKTARAQIVDRVGLLLGSVISVIDDDCSV